MHLETFTVCSSFIPLSWQNGKSESVGLAILKHFSRASVNFIVLSIIIVDCNQFLYSVKVCS